MEPQFCGTGAGVETVNHRMEHYNQIVEEMLKMEY